MLLLLVSQLWNVATDLSLKAWCIAKYRDFSGGDWLHPHCSKLSDTPGFICIGWGHTMAKLNQVFFLVTFFLADSQRCTPE